jgi:hypothetical protein
MKLAAQSPKVAQLSRFGVVSGARFLNFAWSALLIAFMATGTFSSARIGAMTWGPQHDIWSAAIAISQIRFGLSGELAYKEVEQAILNELTSKKSAWPVDNATLILDKNPANVTRGFEAAAALKKKNLVIPATKDGYVSDWAEDIGYADFYNLAFRLFGFNAYSTHYLYFSLLTAAFVFFGLAFFKDAVAVGSLTLSVTALFLLSSSSFFSDLTPSFAANRFLSTLAIIPLLHVVITMLRRASLTRFDVGSVGIQSLIMSFAIAARGSTAWCPIAAAGVGITIFLLRRWRVPKSERVRLRELGPIARQTKAYSHPAIVTGMIFFVAFITYSAIRGTWIDARYYLGDNYPHHLVWHSAYIGLGQNPDWANERPTYPDVPAGGDNAGFKLFQHVMTERGLPYASTTTEIYHQSYYRARAYEAFIRNQYLEFVIHHPLYDLELFPYYKPLSLYKIIAQQVTGIPKTSWLLAACSLVLASLCFACGETAIDSFELIASCGAIWLASLAPVIWAYAVPYTVADQFWSAMFLPFMVIAYLCFFLMQRFFQVYSPLRSPTK